ncbi:hypothetical protein [Helicobacter pylori]|uniref:Uncharacterized protein n=1 Tax=Helicobacter pylori NQ4044 TaxID=992028 RepID=J0JID3_HELPX|nr:hypothetical protein HPNQ4044_0287 [Helicobacter pylori NQ4044]
MNCKAVYNTANATHTTKRQLQQHRPLMTETLKTRSQLAKTM